MKKISIFLAILTVSLFQSCVKDPIVSDQNQTAPSLPPLESLLMPFAGFTDADTSDLAPGKNNSRGVETHWNWFYSVSNVVAWNTILTVGFAVPVASFAEAFNHQAVYQGNSIWLWSYNFVLNNQVFKAELTGEILNAQEIQWDMYIVPTNGFSKIHWFTGTMSDDGHQGIWKLFYEPDQRDRFITIEYAGPNATTAAFIRYTNTAPNEADNGSYIEYRENTNSPFDRGYNVYRADDDSLLEIEWNEGNHSGRVKCPSHFNDNEWRCWSERFVDIKC
ncbi:MAG: hypothetical protein IPL46_15415 [Saprospiraceae bacterium]|nr:hypothetical protein [Saprospiraceae bacterium]